MIDQAAAAAPAPAAPVPERDEAPLSERLLHQLREYQASSAQERSEVRQERAEQSARLVRLEHQLLAEEQIGQDLARRIEALEEAIRQERQLERPKGPMDPSCRSSLLQSELKPAPEVLAAYLERLPKAPAVSCREALRRRLQDARIDLEWPGEGPQSAPRPAARPAGSGPGAAWQSRWSLRGHLDATRCMVLDDSNLILVTSGEDVLVKCWDLRSIWRVDNTLDMEPFNVFRGHSAAVLALTFRPQDRMLFSAGLDSVVRAWSLLDGACDSLELPCREAVWALEHHPHLSYLATASADGLLGLWNTEAEHSEQGEARRQAVFKLNVPGGLDVPSCACWVPSHSARLLAGYTSSRIAVFDAHHGTQVLDMPGDASGSSATSACGHQLTQLMATGHVDGQVRLLDLASGRCVGNLAHPEMVTSLGFDPINAHSLVTGCHDGAMRTFDLRMGRTMRLALHQRKYNEGLQCLEVSTRLLATGGADGNINVLTRTGF